MSIKKGLKEDSLRQMRFLPKIDPENDILLGGILPIDWPLYRNLIGMAFLDLPSEDHDICNEKGCGEPGDTGKKPVKLIQKGAPQHVVSAFFNLVDDYNLNIAPQNLLCFNKFGKPIGLYIGKNWFVEIVIGKPNIYFFGMFD